MSTTPYEIVVAPASIYVAPHGEAFPDVDEAPAGNWVLLGSNGKENMDPAGVTINQGQTVDLHTPYGTTAPVKATRSAESIMFSFTLWDLLAVEYARLVNHNTVTPTAAGSGTPGYDTVNIYQGFNVTNKAWLIRLEDGSPEGTGWNAQWEYPKGVIQGSPALSITKNAPIGLAFEVQVLFDTTESSGEELGRFIVQDATALA